MLLRGRLRLGGLLRHVDAQLLDHGRTRLGRGLHACAVRSVFGRLRFRGGTTCRTVRTCRPKATPSPSGPGTHIGGTRSGGSVQLRLDGLERGPQVRRLLAVGRDELLLFADSLVGRPPPALSELLGLLRLLRRGRELACTDPERAPRTPRDSRQDARLAAARSHVHTYRSGRPFLP